MEGDDRPRDGGITGNPQSLEEVLASIRALVSAETTARMTERREDGPVLMLTADMRVDTGPARSGELLTDGMPPGGAMAARRGGEAAPILDEEALRGVVNRIVREELQGELGDRISRNLRKLIRREIGQVIEDRKPD